MWGCRAGRVRVGWAPARAAGMWVEDLKRLACDSSRRRGARVRAPRVGDEGGDSGAGRNMWRGSGTGRPELRLHAGFEGRSRVLDRAWVYLLFIAPPLLPSAATAAPKTHTRTGIVTKSRARVRAPPFTPPAALSRLSRLRTSSWLFRPKPWRARLTTSLRERTMANTHSSNALSFCTHPILSARANPSRHCRRHR